MSGGPGSPASGRTAVFLEEMGIGPLWTVRARAAHDVSQPVAQPALGLAPAPVPMQPPPPVYQAGHEPRSPMVHAAGATPAGAGESAPVPVSDEQIAAMDWAQLRAAIQACTRCSLCAGGRRAVLGSGAQQAQWVIAAGTSSAADEKEGDPLAGEPGKLLVNMLAAVGLARHTNAYVTNLVKCRPTTASGADRAPTAEEASACRPFLEREVALTGAAMVLTMGQIAANGLLGKALAEPLAAVRGQVHALRDVPLVATLHPGELLRRGADKALAWSDLCLAKAHDGRPG